MFRRQTICGEARQRNCADVFGGKDIQLEQRHVCISRREMFGGDLVVQA